MKTPSVPCTRFLFACCFLAPFLLLVESSPIAAQDGNKALWDAAREGDLARVNELLEEGIDVNAKTQYGATALSYACDRGHLEIVERLLEAGADPNVKDSFYQATPLTWALIEKHHDIVKALMETEIEGIDEALQVAIGSRDEKMVQLILDTERVSDRGVIAGLQTVRAAKLEKLIEMLEAMEVDEASVVTVAPAVLAKYVGTYAGDGVRYRIESTRIQLMVVMPNGQRVAYQPLDDTSFEALNSKITFTSEDDKVTGVTMTAGSNEFRLKRIEEAATAAESTEETTSPEQFVDREEAYHEDLRDSSINWPSFRGTGARGIAEGQNGPSVWDAALGVNTLWKVEVPGLGLSCPVVHGNRVFVTSAVSTEDKAGLKIGHYGDVDSVEDNSEHEFVVFCYDKWTGDELWRRTAHVGAPLGKRHLKSSHANPTPTTDGRFVVVSFGSEGLYCYDMDGNLAWSRDLGALDSGWFYDASYQWGFGSSPIIHGDRVIVQCDIQEGSFLASLDLLTGQDVWRVSRDEIPTWSTPTVCETPEGAVIVTNGTRAARGYDAESGELRWWFSGHSEIAVPTPFMAHDLVFVTSGYRPIQPIFAVYPTAKGDLKPKPEPKEEDEETGEGESNENDTDENDTDENDTDGDDTDGDDTDGGKVEAEVNASIGEQVSISRKSLVNVAASEIALQVDAEPAETGQDETQEKPGFAWELGRGGPYLPTPIVYGDFLYVCTNRGIISCYEAKTGKQVYRERLQDRNAASFTGSPVASDGRIYLTSEQGYIVVLKAGPEFKVLATNYIGEYCLTTPAISEGIMFFRGAQHLIAVRQQSAPRP